MICVTAVLFPYIVGKDLEQVLEDLLFADEAYPLEEVSNHSIDLVVSHPRILIHAPFLDSLLLIFPRLLWAASLLLEFFEHLYVVLESSLLDSGDIELDNLRIDDSLSILPQLLLGKLFVLPLQVSHHPVRLCVLQDISERLCNARIQVACRLGEQRLIGCVLRKLYLVYVFSQTFVLFQPLLVVVLLPLSGHKFKLLLTSHPLLDLRDLLLKVVGPLAEVVLEFKDLLDKEQAIAGSFLGLFQKLLKKAVPRLVKVWQVLTI